MGMPAVRQPKARSRTFTACLTCRARKVKCDLESPSCRNCLKLGISCPGYGIQLQWLTPWQPAGHQQPNTVIDGLEVRRARTNIFGARTGLQFSNDLIQQLAESSCSTQLDQLLEGLDERAVADESCFDNGQDWHLIDGPDKGSVPGNTGQACSVPRTARAGQADSRARFLSLSDRGLKSSDHVRSRIDRT